MKTFICIIILWVSFIVVLISEHIADPVLNAVLMAGGCLGSFISTMFILFPFNKNT